MPRRRHAPVTRMRQRAELRAKNVLFMRQVQQSKERASLRTEQARLHSLIFEQIAPQLRERVHARRETISNLLMTP